MEEAWECAEAEKPNACLHPAPTCVCFDRRPHGFVEERLVPCKSLVQEGGHKLGFPNDGP